MGQRMKLRVVAEGVENDMQRDVLSKLRCDGFQGYLFSPPLVEDDFLIWMRNQADVGREHSVA